MLTRWPMVSDRDVTPEPAEAHPPVVMEVSELGAPEELEAEMQPSSSSLAEQEANQEKARSLPRTGEFPLVAEEAHLVLPIPEPPTGRSPYVRPEAHEVERWMARIDALEREAELQSDRAKAARLYLVIGRLYEEHLAEPREAATAYQRAFNLNPADRLVLSASRSLFAKVANWPMVLQILEHEIQHTSSLERKAALLSDRGSIYEDKLKKAEPALKAYQEALDVWPGEPSAINALERLHLLRREYRELYEVYGRALANTQKPYRRIPLLLSSAQLAEDRLDEPKKAISHYQALLEVSPEMPLAVAALRRLSLELEDWPLYVEALTRWADLSRDPKLSAHALSVAGRVQLKKLDDPEAALATWILALEADPSNLPVLRDIEALYFENGQLDEVLKVIARQVEVSRDAQDEVPILMRLAALHEAEGDTEQAMLALQSAVDKLSSYIPARQELGRLYHQAERFEDLAKLFEAEIELDEDPASRQLKLLKLAEISEKHLADDEAALALYQRALELEDSDPAIQEEILRLYEKMGRWKDYAERLFEMAEATQDEALKIARLDRVGQVAQHQIQDLELAEKAYQAILALRPGHLGVLGQLGLLAEQAGRWDECRRLLKQQIAHTDADRHRLKLMIQVASISETHLNQPEAAIEELERVIAEAPDHLAALRQLSRLYRKMGRIADQLTACRAEADKLQGLEHKVTLLFRMAKICSEELDDDPKAIEILQEILSLDPQNKPALRALAEIYERKGAFEALVEVLRQEAGLLTEPVDQAETLLHIAEVSEERLDRADQAAEIYQEVLRHGVRSEVAVDGLVRIYSSAGLWNALSSALSSALEHTADVDSKVALLIRAAEIDGDKLGNLNKALASLEEAAELQPENLSVLSQLMRVALARRDWPKVIEVAKQLSQTETDPRLYAARQMRMAVIKETLLDPPESGAEHYRLALQTVPDHPVALRALEMAYLRAAQWPGLLELYHHEALLMPPGADRAETLSQAADIAEERLGDPKKALELYSLALEDEPKQLIALEGAQRCAEALRDAPKARAFLERIVGVVEDEDRAEALLLDLAHRQESEGGDLVEVAKLYQRMLERSPAHREAFVRLNAMYEAHDQFADRVDLMKARAEAIDDPVEQFELHFEAAKIAEDQLKQPHIAIHEYTQALEIDPEHAESLTRLGPLLVAGRAWTEAADIMHRSLAVCPDPEVQHRSLKALGTIYHDHQRDLVKCVQSLQAALQIRPGDVEALQRLASVYEEAEDWRSSLNVLLRLAEVEEQPIRRVSTLLEIGRIYEKEFSDTPHAVMAYEKALEILPTNETSIRRLMAAHEQAENWEELTAASQAYMARLPEDERPRAAPLHQQLAGIFENRLNDDIRAISELQRALESDPSYDPALVELARMYSKQTSTYPQAIALHRRLLSRDPFRVESYRAMHGMFEKMRQHDRAFLAAEVLVLLRAEQQAEALYYAEHKSRVPPRAAGQLTEEDHLRLLVHKKERSHEGLIRQILSILGVELSRMYPGDLGLYELNPRQDRPKAQSNNPIRLMSDDIAQVLGAPPFELWITKAYDLELFIENTKPLAFIVGVQFERRIQDGEQRFLLGREIERMCGGHHLLTRVSEHELLTMLEAVVYLGDPKASFQSDPGEIKTMAKNLSRALPGRVRRTLEGYGRQLAGLPISVKEHIEAAAFTRDRAGLSVSNNLEAAMRPITLASGKASTVFRDVEHAREVLGGLPQAKELLAFALSEEYFKLRQKLGFSIQS